MQTRSQTSTKTKEFQKACKEGNQKLAFTILLDYPTINISADNELAFNSACFGGHLETAKWLLSIKPDIDICICDYEAYRVACGNGHINIAEWYHTKFATCRHIRTYILLKAIQLAERKNHQHIIDCINKYIKTKRIQRANKYN